MSFTFMKKGAAAQASLEQAKAKDDLKGTTYRFRLPKGIGTEITFLDGILLQNGLLDIITYHEHQIYMNGNWNNFFPCVGEEEPCPICEGGHYASLVGVFTIIDHSEWTDGQGALHVNERKLFVAKRPTIELLQLQATKRGGIAGCRFEVMRTNDEKSANVGNVFEFVNKSELPAICQTYKVDGAYDYEKVIPYFNADKLRTLGFGTPKVGAQDAPTAQNAASLHQASNVPQQAAAADTLQQAAVNTMNANPNLVAGQGLTNNMPSQPPMQQQTAPQVSAPTVGEEEDYEDLL